jgi:hypothetical protein
MTVVLDGITQYLFSIDITQLDGLQWVKYKELNNDCITLVSLYLYTMIHGQQNIKFIKQFGYRITITVQSLYYLSVFN